MRRLSVAILLAGLVAAVALVGCGGGGGGGGSSDNGGSNGGGSDNNGIVITGLIQNQMTGEPVSGVTVTLGQMSTQIFLGISQADGTFRVVLPVGVTMKTIYPSPVYTFSLDTADHRVFDVNYNGMPYDPSTIAGPVDVWAGTSNDLGRIRATVLPPPGDDGGLPPPP